jgi:uncharacterized Zn finger protein (UPF0148 family)
MSAYDHSVRILICESCGAPLHSPALGGSVTCRYCSTTTQLTDRDEQSEIDAIAQRGQIDDADRYTKLRQQDGKPRRPPESLHHYMVAGQLPAQLVDEAMEDWKKTRAELVQGAGFGTQERLFYLALLLNGPLGEAGDEERRRAVLESTLEALSSKSHKQSLRCTLARQAARVGELDAAVEWLAPCDPQSEDLHVDTEYRFAAAYLATARGDWREVFNQLGSRPGDIPIGDGADLVCAVLRANAHEKSGDLPRAIELLSHDHAVARMPSIERIVTVHAQLRLCAEALPEVRDGLAAKRAAAPRRSIAKTLLGSALGFALPIGFVIAGLTVDPGAQTDDGYPLNYFFYFMAACFGLVPALGLLFAITGARRQRYMARHGIDGMAKLLELEKTNTKVNNNPLYKLKLEVYAEGLEAYELELTRAIAPEEAAAIKPGVSLRVRVDPKNPKKTIFI